MRWLLLRWCTASYAASTSHYTASTAAAAITPAAKAVVSLLRRDASTFQPTRFACCRGGPQSLACCDDWCARGWSSGDNLLAAMHLSEVAIRQSYEAAARRAHDAAAAEQAFARNGMCPHHAGRARPSDSLCHSS